MKWVAVFYSIRKIFAIIQLNYSAIFQNNPLTENFHRGNYRHLFPRMSNENEKYKERESAYYIFSILRIRLLFATSTMIESVFQSQSP